MAQGLVVQGDRTGANDGGNGPNQLQLNRLEANPAIAGLVVALAIYICAGNTVTSMSLALYTDKAGPHPDVLIVQTAAFTLVNDAWNVVPVITPASTTNGQITWGGTDTIAGTTGGSNWDTGAATTSLWESVGAPWPNPWTQPSLFNGTARPPAFMALAGIRPDADTDATGWSTAPLFSKVNDISDATVITSTI